MKIKLRILAILLVGIFIFSSLNITSANILRPTTKENIEGKKPMPQIFSSFSSNPPLNWTFMAYLDGDSELEDEAIEILNRMELAGSDSHLNIVVQIDDKYIWDGQTRRYYVTYDTDLNNISSELADNDTSEKNMAEAKTLTDFICWAVDNYPAEYYCLVIYNHGSGWRGVCWDESCGNYSNCLTMKELKQSMKSLYDHLGKNLDILCFNACMMGNIEVFYEVKDYVDIGIASEDVQNAYLPYDLFLKDLRNNPSWTSEQFAREIVNDSFNSYNNAVDEISAYHTSGVVDIAGKVDVLAGNLIKYLSCYYFSIRLAISKSLCPYVYYDLYDFASEIKNRFLINQEIKDSAQDVMDAIDNAVIESQSKSYGDKFCNGLSLYLETHPKFYPSKYEKLDFSHDTQWDDFLRAYLKIPRSKPLPNTLFMRLLEQFPNAFPILRQLLNL